MHEHHERLFVQQRMDQEHAAASRAVHGHIRAIHLDLAERYRRRLHELDGPAAGGTSA